MTDVDTACYLDVRNARTVDADSTAVENREKCGICFPEGTIPDHVDEVVAGRYTSKVHLSDDHVVDSDEKPTLPDEPSCGADGLAAKIGSKDFGPEDLDELASTGGDA